MGIFILKHRKLKKLKGVFFIENTYLTNKTLKGGENNMTKTIKKLIATGSSLVLLANAASPILAVALNDDVTTVVNQGVNAGALTMQAPDDVTMDDVTVSSDTQTVGGGAFSGDGDSNEANNWKVDDARGHKPTLRPGWSLTVVADDFSDGDAEESVIDVTNLTTTPNDAEAFFSANVADMSLGGAAAFTDADDDGTSDANSVASAPATKGRGRFQGDVGLTLVVPANTDAVEYSTTLTYTVS